MIGQIDWWVFVQRVLWSLPVVAAVMIACLIIFCLSDRVGRKKIDYVYAPEEQKELMNMRRRIARKRILVCVFWIALVFCYLLQYVVDYLVLNGGL